jgi:hypothetical protein
MTIASSEEGASQLFAFTSHKAETLCRRKNAVYKEKVMIMRKR